MSIRHNTTDNGQRALYHLLAVALCSLFVVLCPLRLAAQKKELSQARAYIKSAKYGEAEKLLTTLLNDSANRENRRIWLAWFDAVKGRYEQGNERLYLKQKYDTTAFFNDTRTLFTIGERLDSMDSSNRQRGAAMLHAMRTNLYNGGIYFIHRSQWAMAYDFLEAYIDCRRQPLFQSYDYATTDVRLPEAAYWATFCGYRMNDAVLTLRHRKLALSDSAHVAYTLQYVAEARRWLNDEELYLATLQEGFRRYPLFSYFFPRLVDAYTQRGMHDSALAVADSALAIDNTSQLFLLAKSAALLSLRRYSECIATSDRLISLNDTLPYPWFNAATCYVCMAEGMNPRRDRKLARQAWQSARRYMERYRELMPADRDKWAPALYRIYLNLNMGRQFDEIDRLLKK